MNSFGRILKCLNTSKFSYFSFCSLFIIVLIKNALRWLKAVSSTFQVIDFDVSSLPLVINWCYNHGIKTLPNHWWTRWYHFLDTIGYLSNTVYNLLKTPLISALSAYISKMAQWIFFLISIFDKQDKMQLLAKFKKILYMGFRATLKFSKI